jgi:hypothetical protein
LHIDGDARIFPIIHTGTANDRSAKERWVTREQQSLTMINEKLGELFVAAAKNTAALSSFETAVEVSNQLLANDPEDATAASTFVSPTCIAHRF